MSCRASEADAWLREPSWFLLLPPRCLSRPVDALRSLSRAPCCAQAVCCPGRVRGRAQKPHSAALVGHLRQKSLELLGV